MNIGELLINRKEGNCVGDEESNTRIKIVFEGIDLEKDNRTLVQLIFNYVKYLKDLCHSSWIWSQLTKDEAKKLNAIMKTKNKETLKKKLHRFYGTIQEDMYDHIFHKRKIESWQDLLIELQLKEHLWNSGEILMGVGVK